MLEIISWLMALGQLLLYNGYAFMGFLVFCYGVYYTIQDHKRVKAYKAAKAAKEIADAEQSTASAMHDPANAATDNANAMQSSAMQSTAMQRSAKTNNADALHCPKCNAEVNRNSFYRVQKRGYCSKCKLA